MAELDETSVIHLRTMARDGATASEMLRSLICQFAPKELHQLTLIKYMRESFGLTLQEASPISGWSANGQGELSDSQLDAFLVPEIQAHQHEWDQVLVH